MEQDPPKPPAGTFPAQLGNFNRSSEVNYLRSNNKGDGKYFFTYYKSANLSSIEYSLWNFTNAADARKLFQQRKTSAEAEREFTLRVESRGDSRFASIGSKGSAYTYWLDGSVLHYIDGLNARTVIDFDAQLTNQTAFSREGIPEISATAKPNVVTVTKLIDDYKADPKTADNNYKGKTFVVSGGVAVVEKDKKGDPLVGFIKPGAKSANEGMVICSFQKSDEPMAATIKKGQTIELSARVLGAVFGNVLLQNCAKP
jgi:hypothetical protein